MRHSILVIDDDTTQRLLYRAYLETRFDIIESTNAEEGVVMMISMKPSLVLLDNMLPGESGKSLLAELYVKAIEHPPIIFMSGVMSEDLRRRVLALGAIAAFEKSQASELLMPAIEKALLQKTAAA